MPKFVIFRDSVVHVIPWVYSSLSLPVFIRMSYLYVMARMSTECSKGLAYGLALNRTRSCESGRLIVHIYPYITRYIPCMSI